MHVFQRGALARRRIVRFAITSASVLVLFALAVLVAGVVSSDGGPVLPAFVGPLQRVLAPPPASGDGIPSAASPTPFRLQLPSLPFFSSAPTPTPTPTTTTSPRPAASSPPAASPRTGPPSSSPSNGPPTTFPGRTPPPHP